MGRIIQGIVFIALVFLVELYFNKKLQRSVRHVFKIKKIKRGFIIIPLVVLNIYPVFLFSAWSLAGITNSPVLIPENVFFDYLVIYPFWLMILISVQCGLFFLILDVFNLFTLPFKKIRQKAYAAESKIIFIIILVFIIYVPFRVIYDYNAVQVRTVNFVKSGLPEKLNGLRIVFISDIHADRYTDETRLQKFINDVNAAKPDLVLAGGDMISSTPEYIDIAAEYMGKIKSRYGVFSCVGDHDNWAYRRNYDKSLRKIEKALNDYNVKMINDSSIVLNIKNSPVKITFITDTYVERIPGRLLDSLTADTSGYGLKILLIHQPGHSVVARAADTRYDLFLAGHTHGGQITFLFPFKNLTPTLLETKYVRGNFRISKMLMIVTRGLGMSLVPVRYNSTPEVTVINIFGN